MNDLAIPSTGNPEEDAKQLEQAYLFDARIAEGLCPNGCAMLEWETEYNAKCPDCKFLYSTNLPYGKREIEQVM